MDASSDQHCYHERDPVRLHTASDINKRIDMETESRLSQLLQSDRKTISRRIDELNGEWDIERFLELNASLLAFTGLAASILTTKRWLWLPSVVLGFLTMHAIQGWCPPMPVMRRFGVRTRKEIDREKYACKALRGDFQMTKRDEEDPERVTAVLQAVMS